MIIKSEQIMLNNIPCKRWVKLSSNCWCSMTTVLNNNNSMITFQDKTSVERNSWQLDAEKSIPMENLGNEIKSFYLSEHNLYLSMNWSLLKNIDLYQVIVRYIIQWYEPRGWKMLLQILQRQITFSEKVSQ